MHVRERVVRFHAVVDQKAALQQVQRDVVGRGALVVHRENELRRQLHALHQKRVRDQVLTEALVDDHLHQRRQQVRRRRLHRSRVQPALLVDRLQKLQHEQQDLAHDVVVGDQTQARQQRRQRRHHLQHPERPKRLVRLHEVDEHAHAAEETQRRVDGVRLLVHQLLLHRLVVQLRHVKRVLHGGTLASMKRRRVNQTLRKQRLLVLLQPIQLVLNRLLPQRAPLLLVLVHEALNDRAVGALRHDDDGDHSTRHARPTHSPRHERHPPSHVRGRLLLGEIDGNESQ